jgi:hypothetical protein
MVGWGLAPRLAACMQRVKVVKPGLRTESGVVLVRCVERPTTETVSRYVYVRHGPRGMQAVLHLPTATRMHQPRGTTLAAVSTGHHTRLQLDL